MAKKHITLLRSDNRIVLEPTTPRVRSIVTPLLSFVEKTYVRGKEKYQRRKLGLPEFDETLWECYSEDAHGRLGTSFGFAEKIRAALEEEGYPVSVEWATKKERQLAKKRDETVYRPRWDKIDELLRSGFEYRYGQKKGLRLIAEHHNGRIDCHGGWGKGTLIMLACKLFPQAKIDVITKRVAVMQQRLYPELALNLPSVGMIGGGKRILGRRVMCITADSLHHGRPDADFVFVDEGHEACADKFAGSLGRYEHARMWAFSASWDMRLDNKDLRGEAMFGPIRLKVSYQQGVKHKIVVPIEIVWSDVVMDINPCGDLEGTDKKRYGIWGNDYRNKKIAADARLYDDDTQVLITVETLEHALQLKKVLPEFELVYNPASQQPSDWAWFNEQGLLPDGFRILSDQKRARITKRFEKGRLKKVIATPVWNVGVNFRRLQVLIRADAGGSPVNSTQIPSRNSRPHLEGWDKKRVATIHDYRDQFDRGFRQVARKREATYAQNGWEQMSRHTKRSKLRERMHWEESA